MEFLWTILIPIFITIIFFLYTVYKLPTILKLPADPKEYKKVKNICKAIVAILLVIIISILLGETTRIYINMAGYYLKYIIAENLEIDDTMLWIIVLSPIGFISSIQFFILRKIANILDYSINIFKKNSINKYANILISFLFIFLGLIIVLLSGLFLFKMIFKYLEAITLALN